MAEPTRQPAAAEPAAGLAIREHHPTDPRWRGDLLAQSPHNRLLPADDDPARPPAAEAPPADAPPPASSPAAAGDKSSAPLTPPAQTAEITRERLGDFAPGLLLLPSTERVRVRTLVTYAHSLLDCADRIGPESERLAHVDRWRAAAARAIEGSQDVPAICRGMARENARRRWPAGALEELAACARQRALHPRPATAADAEAEARGLARAVAGALLEARLNSEVSAFVGALIRLRALQHLGEAIARGRSPLPEDEAAEPPLAAVERECARLRPRLLRAPRGLVELPPAYRRAGVFALLAALRLLSEIEESGPRLLTAPPHLGAAARIGLLARARWFRLR